jgi:phosphoribosylanthranilate isomerase
VTLDVKICGINRPEAMSAAIAGGARFVGLVFYPPSPRSVVPELAAELARMVPTGVRVVGLFVDPSDEELERVVMKVPLDMIQLHGSETPKRVAEIRERFSMPVMKAVKIGEAADVEAAGAYEPVADWLLFDAKPPARVASLPGGNGLAFDWTILTGRSWSKPWLLSGGLNAANIADAVATTGARGADISSGVEDRPGHKTPELIRDFLSEAKRL